MVRQFHPETSKGVSLAWRQRRNLTVAAQHPGCQLFSSGADAPNRIADVIGDQQRAGLVDRQPDRPSARMSVCIEEAGDDILGFAVRMARR